MVSIWESGRVQAGSSGYELYQWLKDEQHSQKSLQMGLKLHLTLRLP